MTTSTRFPPALRLENRHTGEVLEDEEGLITAGTLSAEVAGQRLTAGSGHTVRLPHGVPHRWWNAGDQPLGCPARCTGAPVSEDA